MIARNQGTHLDILLKRHILTPHHISQQPSKFLLIIKQSQIQREETQKKRKQIKKYQDHK